MENEGTGPVIKVKNTLSVIGAFGLLMALFGFAFVVYQIGQKQKQLQSKTDSLSLIDSLIRKANDSLSVLHNSLSYNSGAHKSDSTAILQLDSLVQASKNPNLKRVSDSFLRLNTAQIHGLMTNHILVFPKDTSSRGSQVIIYIQVNDTSTLKTMKQEDLIGGLKRKNYHAYGYEIKMDKCNNEIRYFHSDDADMAQQIAEDVKTITGTSLSLILVKGFESKVPEGQFELWIKMK